MIQIYFDDNLINEDYYTSLSTSFSLFSDTFFLGSTAANVYNLSIAKEAVQSHPNIVTIKDEGILIATLVVDEVKENDFEYTYTLIDKMVNLEFKYDASDIFTNRSATLLEIVQDICNKAGIELATMDFRGYSKGITWYDNTRTAREYIGYIAELNGGYAQIGKDGRLYFIKQNTPSAKTISIDDCADFKIGEKHKITRVIYEQGALKYEYGDESGNTLYLNGDNVYITDQTEVEEIYNEIKGFEFYSFNTSNCPIDYNIMAGQVITFVDGENSYPTIAGYDDLTFNGDWYGGYNLEVATKKQEETQVIGTSEKIRDLSIKVDRETNKITQAIKEIDDQNNKISQVTQTVDELNSKIGDIADITTSQETLNGTVSFEGINQSEPIYVKIYPTGVNISYLYPHENLYPSETLFMTVRTLRFTNTTTNEYIDYELPTDLLYYDSENYDEFILDYDAQTCVVNKRVGYNADGTTYVLENPSTIEYEYPRINLTDGDYTVELLGYHNAYMLVRLMAQNIYTTQFATKAEVNSEISQTAQEINISVDKKLESYATTTQMNAAINVKSNEITYTVSETYETKESVNKQYSQIKQTTDSITSEVSKKVGNNEIISKINQSAESVSINANKININGTVSANGNFKIDTNGNMQANNGKFTGGSIKLIGGTLDNPKFLVTTENGQFSTTVTPNQIEIGDGDEQFSYGNGILNIGIASSGGLIQLTQGGSRSNSKFNMYVGDAYVVQGNMHALQFLYDSLKDLKKNIAPFNENAIDLIKNIDIYEYNFKCEDDNTKKHIGFVIGDDYNYTKKVTGNDNTGVDNYAYTSLCVKAIQEQQELIEQLQNEIKQLKGEN